MHEGYDQSSFQFILMLKPMFLDRNPAERGKAFEALGETARALAKVGSTDGIVSALPRISDSIKESLPSMSRSRSVGFSLEALQVPFFLTNMAFQRSHRCSKRAL